jgi:hypothetical protein
MRRSFSRQRFSRSVICAGVSVGSALHSGSPRMAAAIVSVGSSPSKARVPVSISKSTQPNAHTSLRLSATRPLACSGLMYAAVPRITRGPARAVTVLRDESPSAANIAGLRVPDHVVRTHPDPLSSPS